MKKKLSSKTKGRHEKFMPPKKNTKKTVKKERVKNALVKTPHNPASHKKGSPQHTKGSKQIPPPKTPHSPTLKKKVSVKDTKPKLPFRRPPTKRELRIQLSKKLTVSSGISLIIGIIYLVFSKSPLVSLLIFAGLTLLIIVFTHFRESLRISGRVKKMEFVFPDFLQLMASNLHAGITIDRAMLLSAREEFDPLDKEILKTGRDITAGKNIEKALTDMADRIGSERISKTILLIISGIKAGGDVATLLEETSVNMREKTFMEKKAASSVLMYVIFISLAVGFGAPALFSLSNLLVEILTTLLSDLPEIDAGNVPFTLSSINISTSFILYFSITFMVVIDILASLILGLVSKGEEKQGLRYLPVLLIISLVVFFVIRFTLKGVVEGLFSG